MTKYVYDFKDLKKYHKITVCLYLSFPKVLEKVYKNTNNHWRALGYKKAISSIKNYPKKIKTLEVVFYLTFFLNKNLVYLDHILVDILEQIFRPNFGPFGLRTCVL